MMNADNDTLAPFIMQLSSVIVSIISNNALKTYGDDLAIGAMTIINAVMILFLMSAIGVTQGAAPIIGTSDSDLIAMVSTGMRLLLSMLPLLSAQMVGASYFQAIGEAKKAAFLGLSRQVLLLIPLLLILPNLFGLNGVWGASALADLISSFIAIVTLKSAFGHLNKLENKYRSEETEAMSFVAQ